MIIVLSGPDSYRSRKKLHYYIEGFKKKYDPSGLNVIRLDGQKLAIEDLRKHAGQMGFLATKRFIVIENLLKQTKAKKILDEVFDYLEQDWSDDNVLVFLDETSDEKGKKKKPVGKLARRLAKEKTEDFPLLTNIKLNQWIGSEVRRLGGKIDNAAILELASLVGSDLWNMSTEIEKLINYKNKQTITAIDVKQMVKAKFDENIFHLTDALASKNAKLSFKLLNDQISSGSHELYLLTMLIRQFRILLQTRELIDQEPNYYTVASRLGIHPFVAQKAIRDARKFNLEELKSIYQQLLEIDIKIKSTSIDPRLLFDLLVTRVCRVTA